jgi:hypothetical protein
MLVLREKTIRTSFCLAICSRQALGLLPGRQNKVNSASFLLPLSFVVFVSSAQRPAAPIPHSPFTTLYSLFFTLSFLK